ncbi:MAG: class I SAM-dependent methyltransferase [Armatimonadetes bacterium]|nr:class I SAM-dependent methyltransferase [Armatimonadota bacterium]
MEFGAWADQYAAFRPRYPVGLFDFIADQAPGRRLAWDCATGNGQAAIDLAERFERVCATDKSEEQISRATAHSRIDYSVQAAEATDFPNACFDAICAAQAVHWFDVERFYAEAVRVARPGAVIGIWGYTDFNVSPAFDSAFRERVLEPVKGDWAGGVRLLTNGYRDIPFPFERIETPPFSIEVTWDLPRLMAYVNTWSGVRRYVERTGIGLLSEVYPLLAAEWGDPATPRPIAMPLYAMMGRI